MKAVDAATMRSLDRRTISETGVPGEVLMERAGAGLAYECSVFAQSLLPRHARRFVLLAGKGNNGGDAFVAARHLKMLRPEMELALFCVCPPQELSGDASTMFELLAPELKAQAQEPFKASSLKAGDIIVDGLLGTGSNGSLKDPFAEWIGIVNSSSLPVIAIDIPSGIDANDGSVVTCAVEADLTVTMALPKTGMLLGEGSRLCGRIRVVDIGIPKAFIDAAPSTIECTLHSDIAPFFLRERFDIHKNSRGHLLVIGGSRLYPGAPALSVITALKAGAGLVTLAMPQAAPPRGALPNAVMLRLLPDSGTGAFNATSLPPLKELFEKADAIAVGPGLSQDPSCADTVRAVVASGRPAVFDADALNLIAANPSLLDGLSASSILTPHPGEMRRLAAGFGIDPSGSREELAKSLAVKTGSSVILKGCRSVVSSPDGRIALNGSGCAALATAGSGDTLSGLAAALLAGGLSAFDAARAAAFTHGLAGELAAPCGSRGLIADELPDFIAMAIKELSPLA